MPGKVVRRAEQTLRHLNGHRLRILSRIDGFFAGEEGEAGIVWLCGAGGYRGTYWCPFCAETRF